MEGRYKAIGVQGDRASVWGLSTALLQAISGWSLAVAGVAAVVAVAAGLLSAFTSSRASEQLRAEARQAVAEARLKADADHARGQAATREVELAEGRSAVLADDNTRLEDALKHGLPPADAKGAAAFARRSQAFAALVKGRAAEIALIVGHGPGAHASGQIMRQALKSVGVQVRWCRLKPSPDSDQPVGDGLTLYADPYAPEAAALMQALASAGFQAELSPASRHDPSLPHPAIVFAAPRKAPHSGALSICNPVAAGQQP